MSVYVDPLLVCLRSSHFPYRSACHLIADTVDELHLFAKRLGLAPAWFQDRPGLPHYDLTSGKRFQALRLGAIEITSRELIRRFRKEKHETETQVSDTQDVEAAYRHYVLGEWLPEKEKHNEETQVPNTQDETPTVSD